jgi:hypothetical protein
MIAYEFIGGLRSHRKQEYAKAYWDFLNGLGEEPVCNIGSFSAQRIRSRLAQIKRISQTSEDRLQPGDACFCMETDRIMIIADDLSLREPTEEEARRLAVEWRALWGNEHQEIS